MPSCYLPHSRPLRLMSVRGLLARLLQSRTAGSPLRPQSVTPPSTPPTPPTCAGGPRLGRVGADSKKDCSLFTLTPGGIEAAMVFKRSVIELTPPPGLSGSIAEITCRATSRR